MPAAESILNFPEPFNHISYFVAGAAVSVGALNLFHTVSREVEQEDHSLDQLFIYI